MIFIIFLTIRPTSILNYDLIYRGSSKLCYLVGLSNFTFWIILLPVNLLKLKHSELWLLRSNSFALTN